MGGILRDCPRKHPRREVHTEVLRRWHRQEGQQGTCATAQVQHEVLWLPERPQQALEPAILPASTGHLGMIGIIGSRHLVITLRQSVLACVCSCGAGDGHSG
jgi:hypothetical protein